MLSNGENLMIYNDFENVPYIPYRILEELLTDESDIVNKFWKLLKYPTADCLQKPNLTIEEKDALIWRGESLEQNYTIFIKPLVSSSMDTAESQIQMRLFRYNTVPNTRFDATILFEIDFLTNEKVCPIYDNGMLCERADCLENTFLQIFNGRDIKVGILEYNRELSRSCQSLMSINNSKTTYGRSIVLALNYMAGEIGVSTCG